MAEKVWEQIKLLGALISALFGLLLFLNRIGFGKILKFLEWVILIRKEIHMADFNKSEAFKPEVKAELIAVLKDTEEFKLFLEHVEQIAIAVFTDANKQDWWKELLEIFGKVVSECSQEAVDAFSGIGNLPTEWKNAPASAWVEFAISFLVSQGKIIAIIWNKPT